MHICRMFMSLVDILFATACAAHSSHLLSGFESLCATTLPLHPYNTKLPYYHTTLSCTQFLPLSSLYSSRKHYIKLCPFLHHGCDVYGRWGIIGQFTMINKNLPCTITPPHCNITCIITTTISAILIAQLCIK